MNECSNVFRIVGNVKGNENVEMHLLELLSWQMEIDVMTSKQPVGDNGKCTELGKLIG